MTAMKNRIGVWSAIAFLIFGIALATGISLPTRADDEQPKQADNEKLAKDLIGTWTLAEAETPGEPSGIGTRLKFFTGTHWMITQPDPVSGEVVFHHGGRYKLDGDTLSGSIEFANANTAGLIGKTHKFQIKVDGDTYTQKALDNEFTETWKRVK
jgi:hypothetical protein